MNYKSKPINIISFLIISCAFLLAEEKLELILDWKKTGEKYKDKILLALEKTIMPELKKNIEVCFYMTPENFKNDYLSTYGSGFSISPIFKQSAWFRFHNKSEDFKNLYFTGAGSHPGAGGPGVVSSAKIIENLILNEDK